MGRHADAERSRGIAGWVVTAVVVVLVLAAITVAYLVIIHRTDSATDGACTGSVRLPVAAGPGAAPAISAAATAYNASKPVARSTCVTATVTQVADDAALAGLTGHWPSDAGPQPGLWVPDSQASLAALDKAAPALAAGHPTDPMAWSPVVLALRSDDVPAVASLAWSALPAAAGPQGSVALPGARHLLLALPPITDNRATSYALQSMLADGRSAALGESEVRAAGDVLRTVGSGAAGSAATTDGALAALAKGGGAVTAVPVVEADLVAFDRAGGSLSAVHPKGATAGDALIAAPITGDWVSQNAAAAASSFQAYLASAPGKQILADHGWRTASAHPAHPLADVDTTATVTRLPAGGPAVDAALAAELGQPVPSSPLSTSSSPTISSASGAVSAPTTTAPTTTTPTTTVTTRTTASSTAATSPPSSPTTATSSSKTSSSKTSSPPTSTSNPAASGPVLTVIVDSSSGMAATDDGRSLLAWVRKALPSVTGGTVTDRVGLWAYSDSGALPPDGYPNLVSTGPLSGTVGGHPRSAALKSAIAGLAADGDRWAYGALIAALDKAPDAAVKGRANRIVLITSGVDETPATPRQMVLDAEAAVKGKVRIDVIGLGSAVPVDAYQEIASAGGGEYVPVTDPAKLGQTLTDLLTLEN